MRELLQHAHAHAYAIAAFDPVSLDFLQGIITAAERARAPVILNLAASRLDWVDFEWFMSAIEAAARRPSVPVAIHVGRDASLEAINETLGIPLIMHGGAGLTDDPLRHDFVCPLSPHALGHGDPSHSAGAATQPSRMR